MSKRLSSKHKAILDDKIATRAVQTVFHANKNGMRDSFRSGRFAGDRATRADFDGLITEAAENMHIYSGRLVGMRLHHKLTKLQKVGYDKLTLDLAYKD